MRKPAIGITLEGFHCIFVFGFATVIFAVLHWWPLAVIGLVVTVFACHFFRDPERVVPSDKDAAVSPADGKIIRITNRPDPFNGEMLQCVSIFMNVFNVHVNRMPVGGIISAIAYKPGRFVNAGLDKASENNERCCYTIESESGDEWHMVQIAGLIARRIVCRVDEGDSLQKGERFGMIKFGSRVDVYLPANYSPSVMVGDAVFAGQTVLARKS